VRGQFTHAAYHSVGLLVELVQGRVGWIRAGPYGWARSSPVKKKEKEEWVGSMS